MLITSVLLFHRYKNDKKIYEYDKKKPLLTKKAFYIYLFCIIIRYEKKNQK